MFCPQAGQDFLGAAYCFFHWQKRNRIAEATKISERFKPPGGPVDHFSSDPKQ